MTITKKIKRLYTLPDEEDLGFSETEIKDLEKSLAISLPFELKKYYSDLGRNKPLNTSHNRLLSSEKEIGFSKDRYLMIYEENQAVVSWGIKEEDLKLDNPPVWGNSGTEEEPDWYLETNSTDQFFLLMAVYNGTMGGLKYNANYLGKIPQNVVQSIEERWTLVPEISFEQQKVYTDNFHEVVSVCFDENNKGTAIFTGTSYQDRFDKILDQIKVNWSYTSYEDEDGDEEE
ncbi:hypothetical protein ACTJIJ_02435 [Niabella sp. 22666]|uniref:hypothetical protein n=1 Tax=Niabella sp. 22666 TaxID=3453954 RepID=UPI003F842477